MSQTYRSDESLNAAERNQTTRPCILTDLLSNIPSYYIVIRLIDSKMRSLCSGRHCVTS